MLNDRFRDDEGVALIFAMLGTLIILGLATVVFQRALTETRVTGIERDYESAIHVAEAGVDDIIGVVNTTPTFVTATATSAAHAYTAGPTIAEQRAWALAIADTPGDCVLIAMNDGEACGIRPYVDVDGDNAYDEDIDEAQKFMFGVGFVPSRDAADRRVRVVKIEFDRGFFGLSDAVRTGGCLAMSGDSDVSGINGNVHTNSCLNAFGSTSIAGTVTYSGTLVGDSTGKAELKDPKPLPDISARDSYEEHVPNHPTDWYDLCPDGSVREPDAATFTPCNGIEITASGGWRGWSLSGDTWSINGGTAALSDGVYFVHEKNARINGNLGSAVSPVQMTVIVSATNPCGAGGPDNGSLKINGTPYIEPRVSAAGGFGILALADRDVELSGTSDSLVNGFIGAHEQIDVGGNGLLIGAIVAEDCPETPLAPSTTGSPVSANSVSGSARIVSNIVAELGNDSVIRVTAWNEY